MAKGRAACENGVKTQWILTLTCRGNTWGDTQKTLRNGDGGGPPPGGGGAPTVLINIGYRRMATFMMYISQEGLMSVFVRQDKLCGYGQTR